MSADVVLHGFVAVCSTVVLVLLLLRRCGGRPVSGDAGRLVEAIESAGLGPVAVVEVIQPGRDTPEVISDRTFAELMRAYVAHAGKYRRIRVAVALLAAGLATLAVAGVPAVIV